MTRERSIGILIEDWFQKHVADIVPGHRDDLEWRRENASADRLGIDGRMLGPLHNGLYQVKADCQFGNVLHPRGPSPNTFFDAAIAKRIVDYWWQLGAAIGFVAGMHIEDIAHWYEEHKDRERDSDANRGIIYYDARGLWMESWITIYHSPDMIAYFEGLYCLPPARLQRLAMTILEARQWQPT